MRAQVNRAPNSEGIGSKPKDGLTENRDVPNGSVVTDAPYVHFGDVFDLSVIRA